MIQEITSMEEALNLRDNQIIGNYEFINSKVIFKGKNNILSSPEIESPSKIILRNSTIIFHCNNSVIFLDKSRKDYLLTINIFNNSFCSIGSNNFFNGVLNLQCSEQSNIIIGNDCLFSFGVWIRTSDVHLIYDATSKKRINKSKSLFIGDHVWIGQDSKIFKGSRIGSGAIISANAFISKKCIPSNTIWGGTPAKLIKRNVFFLSNSSHAYTTQDTKKWSEYIEDKYIYKFSSTDTTNFLNLEKKILALLTAQERAEFLLELSKNSTKNRYYVNLKESRPSFFSYIKRLLKNFSEYFSSFIF